jgi:hypothetical protein
MATGRAPPPHFALQWRDAYLDCVLSFRPKHEWRHANSRQLIFLNFAQKNKQTFGYANKWLYFFFAGCKLLLIVRAALLRQALGRKTPQRW